LDLISDENSTEETFMLVGLDGGGCSSFTYKLVFNNIVTEIDKIFEDKGIKIAVDKKSFFYLIGTKLDYEGGLNGKEFLFVDPNASSTCGCGESFDV
jgi:iron-sulfur cluster assembly protein